EENKRVKGQLAKLDALQQQKGWDEWFNTYQLLVDENREGVVTRDEEFLDGLRFRLNGMLAHLPAAQKAQYRTKYDLEARKLFDRASAENNGALMREVYARYRFTSYGPRALLWIADRALDGGNMEIAR